MQRKRGMRLMKTCFDLADALATETTGDACGSDLEP